MEHVDLPVHYYRLHEAEPFFVDDQSHPALPTIGDGLLAPGGTRYRVVDRWLSFDHHGRFNDGWHVFLGEAEGTDDRLRLLAPDYFTS